ncbi:unnamed protein product [Caenorhabditis brenneri]
MLHWLHAYPFERDFLINLWILDLEKIHSCLLILLNEKSSSNQQRMWPCGFWCKTGYRGNGALCIKIKEPTESDEKTVCIEKLLCHSRRSSALLIRRKFHSMKLETLTTPTAEWSAVPVWQCESTV